MNIFIHLIKIGNGNIFNQPLIYVTPYFYSCWYLQLIGFPYPILFNNLSHWSCRPTPLFFKMHDSPLIHHHNNIFIIYFPWTKEMHWISYSWSLWHCSPNSWSSLIYPLDHWLLPWHKVLLFIYSSPNLAWMRMKPLLVLP